METSQTIAKIAAALTDFQKTAPNVTKDAKANYGKYATLGNVIETIREPLAKQGLSYSQVPDGDGLTTIIMHTSGEWIKSTATLKLDKATPQGQGSAITYMRRYALSAALGLATEDDDDGAEASKPARPAQPRQAAPQSTKPADPDTGAKIKMAGLLSDLGHKGLKGAVFTAKVKELTELDVVPENYADIIGRLETLKDEANQK